MAIVKGAVAGAIAGLAGAFAMEQFQSWWSATEKRLAPTRQAGAAKDEPATVKAAERITETVLEAELPDDAKPAAGEAVHYGMGALSGAIYGAAAEIVAPLRVGNGLAFGAALWWIADNTAVPAFGLGTPPDKTPPSTHAYALASHLVYGVVTETVRKLVRIAL
ncbi:MAG TPA: DUF1440 domain-containing protein [Candidatus Limnocylindria bacterium]|nr:DUF1440 domain-containing protein [Candidatus Limnocylindria bacterium]